MRDFGKPSPPCLEWPGHQSLLEAQRLRTRTLWQWATAVISRLLHRTTFYVGKSSERGAP